MLGGLRCWAGRGTAVVVFRPSSACSLKPWPLTGLGRAVLAQGKGCRSRERCKACLCPCRLLSEGCKTGKGHANSAGRSPITSKELP